MFKIMIAFFMIGVVSCCSAKKNTTATVPTTQPLKMATNDSVPNVPKCIAALIVQIKNAPVTNPPRKIIQYTFNGATIYYVPAVCCDNFSDLYNSNCQLMGHPSGGFTGRGDGKITNFKEATNEKIIWQDDRTK